MKNIKYTILFIATVMMTVSCSDDFVDVESQNESSENYFNSEQDYQDALIGAYDLLQSTYLNVMLGEIASDNTLAGGESATDVPGFQQIDDMIHTPNNEQLRSIWGWMFAGVNRANYILEFQNKTDFPGKENVLAQARFLRAYYYFELVKWFGDVPLIVDQRFLFGDQFEVDRTPKENVYAQIELDLMYASDNLPYMQSQIGRITKGAAQALLGKVYLYQEKFGDAALVLEDLITSGPYDLVADYSTIFENDNENNIESVFEVQYSDLEGAGFACLQCSEGNVAVGFNGIRNYNGPEFDSGFSFNVPTQEVVDQFESDDPRIDTAILDIEAWSASTGATYGTGYEHTGYYNRKYIARQGDSNIGDQNLTNPNNYRAIRYADVLLMAAEALNRGSIADDRAQNYLNLVRQRAFGDMDHNITSTGSTLTQAIYHERRVELVGEGHHFFDLVRTGRAASEIDGFVTGKNEIFPIPQIEIELTGNRWAQNPGY
ncbi:RagB/SusD family nutrient uptake outer membrane protein [Olleya aquimaris]|uniref:RagB/SusD family nutrient uptake outer membrane protein n=1 Tax=Olleya sediminilitoris TaxID=2795739 RepID=A0ABS1WHN9_9FLAO|nr:MULTISPECIES: RagB/SusD family nutrient uptake outer membrane protein [Olleya]AXO79587.1 RagB/SusD family nutrient uptake outer membrane protein [Olleya aquimaris]MBL7558645.1 RagB/SusD family nutrient uptake outer membrane protein [Olleya sediminilitoris]